MFVNVSDDQKEKRKDTLFQLEQELQSAWFSLVFYPVEGEALEKARDNFLNVIARIEERIVENNGTKQTTSAATDCDDDCSEWFLGCVYIRSKYCRYTIRDEYGTDPLHRLLYYKKTFD